MNILITGGAGYIGSVLINKVVNAMANYSNTQTIDSNKDMHDFSCHSLQPGKIVVYDNLIYKQTSLIDHCYRENFKFVYGDVRDHDKLLPYVKEADMIIPLAAIVGHPACEKDKVLATQVNYEHIKFIIENLSNDQGIISPNTNSGYGIGKGATHCTEDSPLNPVSHYGITKVRAEEALLNSGKAISLRLATVFGASPRMRLDLLVNDFTYKAYTDKYIILFEHHFKRNYIHIHDVALTIIYMLNRYYEHKGQVFNVGLSSANLSKLELCKKIKTYIPDFVIKLDEFSKDPDKRNYLVSNKKLESTGWKPYYTLDGGIQELLQAYKILSHSNKKFTNL